jgi:hypothetical protein
MKEEEELFKQLCKEKQVIELTNLICSITDFAKATCNIISIFSMTKGKTKLPRNSIVTNFSEEKTLEQYEFFNFEKGNHILQFKFSLAMGVILYRSQAAKGRKMIWPSEQTRYFMDHEDNICMALAKYRDDDVDEALHEAKNVKSVLHFYKGLHINLGELTNFLEYEFHRTFLTLARIPLIEFEEKFERQKFYKFLLNLELEIPETYKGIYNIYGENLQCDLVYVQNEIDVFWKSGKLPERYGDMKNIWLNWKFLFEPYEQEGVEKFIELYADFTNYFSITQAETEFEKLQKTLEKEEEEKFNYFRKRRYI